jgi:hypothetical protein
MTRRSRAEQPSAFVLRIEGKPGVAGIRQLRALLKRLLRTHSFRCLDAREVSACSITPDKRISR